MNLEEMPVSKEITHIEHPSYHLAKYPKLVVVVYQPQLSDNLQTSKTTTVMLVYLSFRTLKSKN